MDALEIETAKQRLLSKLEKTDSCWLCIGRLNKNSYGVIIVNGKQWMAHRLSYAVFKGEIPDGMFVCHSCDNPSCVNPDHLWLGSATDNFRDSESKGRASWQLARSVGGEKYVYFMRKPHCRKGHELSDDNVNLFVLPTGRVCRKCKECQRFYAREWKRRKSLKVSGSDGAMDSATDF